MSVLRPSVSRAARGATTNLMAAGAAGGPAAAFGALLSDLAGDMIAEGNQRRDQATAEQGYAEGAAQGNQAATEGAALSLPEDDGSTRNRALKQGAIAGWMARFDVDTATKAETWAAEHADNPAAFRAKWAGLTAGTVKMVPPELQPQVQAELDKRGALAFGRITAAKIAADRRAVEDRQNADILQAQILADRASENAWRENRVEGPDGAKENDAKYLAYLTSRTDLDERAKVVARDKYLAGRQRAAALGEFDRAKGRGLGAAETFIHDFRQPGRHPQMDADAVESVAAEMERATADLREQRRLAVADLRDQAADAIFRAERGYGAGNIDALAAKAHALGAADLARALSQAGRNSQLAGELAKLPLPELQARVQEYDASAKTAPDGATARRAELAKGVLAGTIRDIKADTLAHFRQQGEDVPAIDWSKPETLQTRAKAADLLSAKNRIAVPALTKADAEDLGARMEQSGYEDRARLLGTLYQGLGPRRFPEVLDTIKEKSPEAAQAGALWTEGPQGQRVARDILFGAALRQSVGSAASPGGRQYMPPKDDAFRSEFDRELPPELLSGMDPDTLRGVQAAILSSYAAKSHAFGQANQSTVNTTLFNKAVADVTGGVLEWNGQPMIAPERGMSQDDLDGAMSRLNDGHLKGIGSADGHRVSADQVRQFATFRMLAPGKYLVRIGDGFLVGPDQKPAVLDLGALSMTPQGRR